MKNTFSGCELRSTDQQEMEYFRKRKAAIQANSSHSHHKRIMKGGWGQTGSKFA